MTSIQGNAFKGVSISYIIVSEKYKRDNRCEL